ncbi:MAG: hypothetical protein H8E57_04305 [Candidatus Cloacimonetes bacterium]|nr:hypothetical protein [Candidatus Cloacimonadota bacterium]
MAFDQDFETQWLGKMMNGIAEIGKEDLFENIIQIKQELSIPEWTRKLMDKMKDELTEDEIIKVMTGCACLAPKDNLIPLREEYSKTENIELVHQMLQDLFEKFIKQYKNLDEEQMKFLRENGWGMAGKLVGNTILATKIPKEFHKYFQENDPQKKKYYYCHCPRIRDLFLQEDRPLDVNYCYCGAGFYKDIWEFILQKEVKVEVIKSLMKDDDVCRIAIFL